MNVLYWMIPPVLFALIVVAALVDGSTAPSIRDLRRDEADGEAFFAQMDAIDQERAR